MNAANDLAVYSDTNVTQMEQVAPNSDVEVIVQWKQSTKVSSFSTFNGTRRYRLVPNGTGGMKRQLIQDMGLTVDMGIPQTLNSFIAWGKSHYPADHTAVVLWDHGNGWLPKFGVNLKKSRPSFSRDESTHHQIEVWQLNTAFQGQHVDITAFDCSLMQMAEVAYQFMGLSDYVAGDEESPPGAGYPYQRLLAKFTANPDQTPRQMSKAFVDCMLEEPTYASEKIEQSVIDTSQLSSVGTATATLAEALIANKVALAPMIPGLRNTVQTYSKSTNRYFYDSIDLCTQLSAGTGISAVQTACAGYITAANSAIIWEGHNSHSANSHGLSIDFSPSSFFSSVDTDYKLLAWNTVTGWDQWLSIAP